MTDHDNQAGAATDAERRADRRRFLQLAGTATAVAGGLTLLSACGGGDDNNNGGGATPTPTPTGTASSTSADVDTLNFLLNVEYVKASFFAQAGLGTALGNVTLASGFTPAITGAGTQGKTTGGRAVVFTDAVLAQTAREIAYNSVGHVGALRSYLNGGQVAIPDINIAGDATGAFTAAMRAAGVIGASDLFDPYASESNFLLAAFFFGDLAATAYKGVAKTVTNKAFLEGLGGMLGTSAYHAGTIRSVLTRRGQSDTTLIANAQKISDYRDSLAGGDLDQGITGTASATNITPTDNNGAAYGRTAAQVLNILFTTKTAVTKGGFLPSGVNGNVKTSAAN